MNKITISILALLLSAKAFAGTATVCGVRTGTAGNADLTDKRGRAVISLAIQGGDQSLLDQADSFITADANGESGMQNGTRYCVNAKLSSSGEALEILGAFRQ